MNNKRIKAFITSPFNLIIFYSAVSLLSGAAIYLFFRPDGPIFFDWLNKIGLQESVESIRSNSMIWYPFLPEWMVFSLPNGLWAFSYSALIFFVWFNSTSKIKFFWIGTIPILVFGFELLQLTGSFPGTFCKQDIFFLFAGMIGGITISLNNHKINCYEKKSV